MNREPSISFNQSIANRANPRRGSGLAWSWPNRNDPTGIAIARAPVQYLVDAMLGGAKSTAILRHRPGPRKKIGLHCLSFQLEHGGDKP